MSTNDRESSFSASSANHESNSAAGNEEAPKKSRLDHALEASLGFEHVVEVQQKQARV
jgi:hypothetical protein